MFCSLSHQVVTWPPNLPHLKLCVARLRFLDDWVVSEGHGRVASPRLCDWRPLLWEEGCS